MKDLFNEAEFKILSERMEEIIKEAEQVEKRVRIILDEIASNNKPLSAEQYLIIQDNLPMLKIVRRKNYISIDIDNKLSNKNKLTDNYGFAEHDYYLNINDEKLITLTKGYHYS